MGGRPGIVFLPEMALTLVRRATAKLPPHHYLFRTTPKWTKLEIKEYLEKVYGVKVARLSTSISQGASHHAAAAAARCAAWPRGRC
jgi:ribosomal protein L23